MANSSDELDFEQAASALSSGADGFDRLADHFRAEGQYPLVFEARLMKARAELGLPAILTQPVNGLGAADQRRYDDASIAAAAEVGALFLEGGHIARAWPYLRAAGERQSVADAIEKLDPAALPEDIEDVLGIAFHEGVAPRKGFEIILREYGTCRAITSFSQFPTEEGREDAAHLVVETLHAELLANLRNTIEQQEGAAPPEGTLPELIAERDWLFGEYAAYVDTSHVISVIQFAPTIFDSRTLGLLRELCDYGSRLSASLAFPSEPPFEDFYADQARFIDALLGKDLDGTVAHFLAKIEDLDTDATGTAPAQAVVNVLVRLERWDEAIDVSERHLAHADPQFLSCPSTTQLCQMGKRWSRLRSIARERGDLLSYAAAEWQAREA